ncbi:bacteriocin fulvocin C-related protein [Nonomuraea polychroma]|uniref:bacteriocin fulvocin C-related protein n=1 Tax=Nonomuraea polychroma TaxID=46176 RepID=UPI003D8E98AF
MPYRKAIYAELKPEVKSRLWTEHLTHYRRTHPDLSPKQQQILGDLEASVRNVSAFRANPTDTQAEDERLRLATIDAFGHDEARALMATLGPVEVTSPSEALAVDCECSRQSNFCGLAFDCSGLPSCTASFDGCGWRWQYPCDGMCTL